MYSEHGYLTAQLTHATSTIEILLLDGFLKQEGSVANRLRIGLFAALPWEYQAFRRRLGPWKEFSDRPFKAFTLSMRDKDLLLVETGMGKAMVETALSWAFWSWHPHVLVSFGFAGGLSRSVSVGDVFLCTEIHYFDSNARVMAETGYLIDPHHEILAFCRTQGAAAAHCITTLHLEAKGLLSIDLRDVLRPQRAIHHDQSPPLCQADIPALVDMETYFAARFARDRRLPLLCFRAVSDTYDQELGFQLADISDSQGRVDPWRVFKAVVRNPAIITALMASWRRSHRASQELAILLRAFTDLPAGPIRAILGPGVFWPEVKRIL